MKTLFLPVVTLSAVLIAIYSVASEATMSAFGVTPLVTGGVPTLLGGAILLLTGLTKDKHFFRKIDRISWLKIIINGLCSAAGIFFWFDSVTRIGAGKEMLLSTSTAETLFILLLSFIFLREKLKRVELVGSVIVLLGIFMALFNPGSFSLSFGLGDVEAVMSSLLFALATVIATDVLKRYSPIIVGGIYLVLEGVILLTVIVILGIPMHLSSPSVFSSILALSFLVAAAVFTYNVSLKIAGASLTAVVSSFSGLFAIWLQLLASHITPSIRFVFPPSLVFASVGGFLAVVGVFLVSRREDSFKGNITK